MTIHLCGPTALAAYRSAEALCLLRPGLCAMSCPEVPSAARAREIARLLNVPLPLHVAVDSGSDRRDGVAVRCHARASLARSPSFCELLPGVRVCSPEALFLFMSGRADFENVLMLGMELVGGFAPNKQARKGLLMRPPLTSPAAIRAYLEQVEEPYGRARALRAARYLLPDARSPKEAVLALLVTLPRRLGGQGIDDIVLNRRVDLPAEGRAIARRDYLVCDLYHEGARLELGYDSDDNHLEREDHEADKRRENALRTVGVGFISMTNGQLRDLSAFEAIMAQLASETRTSFRTTTEATRTAQRGLWHRLLFCDRLDGRTVERRKGPSLEP